jgi:hypothetical protein
VPAMLAGIGLARVVTTTSLSSGETATGQSEA